VSRNEDSNFSNSSLTLCFVLVDSTVRGCVDFTSALVKTYKYTWFTKKKANFPPKFDVQKLKSFQFQGAVPDPLNRGSPLDLTAGYAVPPDLRYRLTRALNVSDSNPHSSLPATPEQSESHGAFSMYTNNCGVSHQT